MRSHCFTDKSYTKKLCWHLWCTLSLPDYVIQVVGYVCVQSTGQVPGLTDPVIVLSSENKCREHVDRQQTSNYTQHIREATCLQAAHQLAH